MNPAYLKSSYLFCFSYMGTTDSGFINFLPEYSDYELLYTFFSDFTFY
jgi:hypothetical protein